MMMMILSTSRKGSIHIQDVQLMQPWAMPSRVAPIQQTPDFPGPHSNGWLIFFGSSPGLFWPGVWVGILGFGWGCLWKTGSPGWGTLGGASDGVSDGVSAGACDGVSFSAIWNDPGVAIPASSKLDRAMSNEPSGLVCAIGLATALDMMTARSKKSACIVVVENNVRLATGMIYQGQIQEMHRRLECGDWNEGKRGFGWSYSSWETIPSSRLKGVTSASSLWEQLAKDILFEERVQHHEGGFPSRKATVSRWALVSVMRH